MEPRKCSKRSKRSGKPCKRWATPGTNPPMCPNHGSKTPAVKAKAQENVERDKAMNELSKALSEEGIISPADSFQALVEMRDRWYRAMVAWTRMVANLNDLGQIGFMGEIKKHWAVAAMEEAEERYLKLEALAIKLGLEERRTQALETHAQALAEFVRNFINDEELKLTVKQRQKAPKVARRHLEALEGGKVA